MTFFSKEELQSLDSTRIPRHIAIIPDGNRRWAKEQSLKMGKGHQKGADLIMDTVIAAKEMGVKAITFYGFSTENWKRSPEEVDLLLWLAEAFLTEQLPQMIKEGVRFRTLGVLEKLSPQLQKTFAKTKEATQYNDKIDFVIAMNYGARDEITRAVKRIVGEIQKGSLTLNDITEDLIDKNLDSYPLPDPDLLIRTSGENRISNFMLWQLSYSELYTVSCKWPAFTPKDLMEAVRIYQDRERRRGL